jgi:hypothetical protein
VKSRFLCVFATRFDRVLEVRESQLNASAP